MDRLTFTPFAGRPAKPCPHPEESPPDRDCSCGKWAIFDELRLARAAFGVTDRDLTVLWALLSFLPGPDLCPQAGLVVFPSNAALSDRTHGMAESTLRRHLAALVAAGLIARHDSPNGKRYARRGRDGAVAVAFGFDLGPLLLREAAIRQAASAARDAADAALRAREAAVLALRDLRGLLALAAEQGTEAPVPCARLAALSARLRRRMSASEARALAAEVQEAVAEVKNSLYSGGMGGNAAETGRQHTESRCGLIDSESAEKDDDGDGDEPATVPLHLVVRACPEIALYATAPIRRWRELQGAADRVRPMMGVSRDAWDDARGVMGDPQAAMVLAAILQKSGRIRSPGGYLRHLTRQAARGRFRPGGMILSLLRDG